MAESAREAVSRSSPLPAAAAAAIRAELPRVADDVVAAIIAEVPSYEDALGGRMGSAIRDAVQLALGGFLSLASGVRDSDPRTPTAPAVDGAYQLGRGEARDGRTTEALLSAYRIGARVSWREMSAAAVAGGLAADEVASFAELVFAYIDELSASSVAGHDDELATTGRVRERLLEQLARHLVAGASEQAVRAAAEEAGWTPPETLTAIVVPAAQVRPALAVLSPATLQAGAVGEVGAGTDLEDAAVLLVPEVHGGRRATVLRRLEGRGVVLGPARPWLDVHRSVARAARARALGLVGDTDEQLDRLVLTADPEALADLREQVLAPLADLKPAAAEKLAATLRSWLLHQGRRDQVAADLFVHPQTVRYRMGQVRELYGDRLEDPTTVLRLVLALGGTP